MESWSGVDLSGVRVGVEWSGLESRILGLGSWIPDLGSWVPDFANVREQNDYLFSGQSDNFHFSKVSHFCSFCEAHSKMDLKSLVAPTFDVLENAF